MVTNFTSYCKEEYRYLFLKRKAKCQINSIQKALTRKSTISKIYLDKRRNRTIDQNPQNTIDNQSNNATGGEQCVTSPNDDEVKQTEDDISEDDGGESRTSQKNSVLQIRSGYDENPSINKSTDSLGDNDLKFVQVATLQDGDSFGELALINHKPRSATIRCLTDCKFAVLSK